jgi:CheY-like chemotaxis protein
LPLLHIDDSAEDRCLVKEAIAITKTPFTYHEAEGLESALSYFQLHGQHGELEQHPAMVLLDYQLDGNSTGVDFLYWLRVRKKITSLPVVMFSGSPGTGHIAECYAAGADHYLTKPNQLERLKRIVRTLHTTLVCNIPGPIRLLDEYKPDSRDKTVKTETT